MINILFVLFLFLFCDHVSGDNCTDIKNICSESTSLKSLSLWNKGLLCLPDCIGNFRSLSFLWRAIKSVIIIIAVCMIEVLALIN